MNETRSNQNEKDGFVPGTSGDSRRKPRSNQRKQEKMLRSVYF
jgi:hypothetical protein